MKGLEEPMRSVEITRGLPEGFVREFDGVAGDSIREMLLTVDRVGVHGAGEVDWDHRELAREPLQRVQQSGRGQQRRAAAEAGEVDRDHRGLAR